MSMSVSLAELASMKTTEQKNISKNKSTQDIFYIAIHLTATTKRFIFFLPKSSKVAI